jgi:hypothetical protein
MGYFKSLGEGLREKLVHLGELGTGYDYNFLGSELLSSFYHMAQKGKSG